MRETDIRPVDLMGEQVRRFASDIARLRAGADQFVLMDCPACNSADSDPKFEKFGFSFVSCRNCGTMFVNPRPTDEQLRTYYETSEAYEYWNEVIFPASESARRSQIFMPRAERILSICDRFEVGQELLVDVGAGFGTFCEEIQAERRFSRVIAIEPTPGLAETCRNRGLEVVEARIEEAELSGRRADVVTAFEVIEHLLSPSAFVAACAEVLQPGGLLVTTCPNIKGFDISVLGSLSDSIDPEHLNYFSPESLSLLMERHGFEILEVSTPGELDAELVRNKILEGSFSVESQPFLKQVLVERWEDLGVTFQSFLAHNLLSSHLWVVARAPDVE